jgi:alpha-ketoglutarate-dependent taurine dioxygenase
MTQSNDNSSPMNPFSGVKRKAVRLSPEGLIATSYLNPERQFPLVMKPRTENLDLSGFAAENRASIETALEKHGAILFRGFQVKSVQEFERFVTSVSGKALEYKERSSPRSQISGRVYTSTDYPPDKSIFLHNEQSYNLVFPMRISFFCGKVAQTGGATPIADTRKVFERIAPEIRERLIARKYQYVRNFGDGFGLNWKEAFQTKQRAEVEEYCRANQIECEWKPGNRLRTKQVRRVAARHPKTGDWVWFNHLTFFHIDTLDPAIREEVVKAFGEENLPNNTYYGDGCRIEEEVMAHLRDAYQQESVLFNWEEGDILMLDNMLAAHGREPYTGERRVAVAMAAPWEWDRV